jgi:pyruvate/2-oxoglutarate dehydrogenase complex dihydrolipoamide dehydrogenase (E3) component
MKFALLVGEACLVRCNITVLNPAPLHLAAGPKGSVKVDELSRTNVPSIWAVGDVTSRIALTPVAKMEGQAVGLSIATGQLTTPGYDAVPSACFSWPYVATVVSADVFMKRHCAAQSTLLSQQ